MTGMQWKLAIDFAIISAALICASVLRAKVRFLQRFLVPNAVTAGFTGLGLFHLAGIVYPELQPSREALGNIVYHLLAVTFISIALKKRARYVERNAVATSFHLTLGYAVEGFLGYSLTLLFMSTLVPGLFPTFGMLFEIGFGQSSGQAYALGKQWESLGFSEGGTVGLTFGAIGFLWAFFTGIPFLNWGVKKGLVQRLSPEVLRNTGFYGPSSTVRRNGRPTTHPDAVSSGAFHLAVVGAIYLAVYLSVRGLTGLITRSGGAYAEQLGSVLWAYHAFLGTLIAMLVGRVIDRAGLRHLLDDATLTGIAAGSVDFLVTAAIMAIQVVVVARYAVPILIICLLGGSIVLVMVFLLARSSFDQYQFERALSIYGLLTGTVSSGLALVRVVDPDFKTPVAGDLVLGSGFSLFLGMPLLFLINLPALFRNWRVYLLTDAALFGYVLLLFAAAALLGMLRRPGSRSVPSL
jgi:ESS family glutamate:Na+ symporter